METKIGRVESVGIRVAKVAIADCDNDHREFTGSELWAEFGDCPLPLVIAGKWVRIDGMHGRWTITEIED